MYNIGRIKKRKKVHSQLPLTMNFPHDNMITLKSVFFKSNIKKYYDYCEKTDFFIFSCPNCQCPGCLVKHGYYQRFKNSLNTSR